jgi:uncharacterized protein YneF (UPF0154 family)
MTFDPLVLLLALSIFFVSGFWFGRRSTRKAKKRMFKQQTEIIQKMHLQATDKHSGLFKDMTEREILALKYAASIIHCQLPFTLDSFTTSSPYKRGDFNQVRKTLMELKIIKWRNKDNHTRGLEVTPEGRTGALYVMRGNHPPTTTRLNDPLSWTVQTNNRANR